MSTGTTSTGIADTYDWDTAYAIQFKDANTAIVKAKSSPASFSGQYADGLSGNTYNISGNFGDWQLNGGSGSIVHMSLPINSGVIAPQSGGNSQQYLGTAMIEVYLNYIPQPTDGVASTTSGQTNHLIVKTTTNDPVNSPVASVLDFQFDPNSPSKAGGDAIKDVLTNWLNANLQQFNHVFSAVDVNQQADKDAFQWLKPTKLGYAINAPQDVAVDNYIFGVLAMTEKRDNPNLSNELSPNIIPTGANSGFLISQERFIEKIFMPGVYLIFNGASAGDFDTTNDGTTITNIQSLSFQNFKLEDGTIITDATVDAGKFTLTAFDSTLELQFTDLHFTWRPGYIVHLDYTGVAQLYLDENHHLQMKEVAKPSLNVIVTKTTAEKWEELIDGIIIGIVTAVVGAVIGGALGPAAEGAGEAAGDAAEGGAEAADGAGSDAMSFSAEGVLDDEMSNPDEVESEDDSDASQDLDNAGDESYTSKFKGWFGRNWSKILGMAIGGAVGAVVAKLPDIMEAYAEKNLEKMPTLDEFADEAVSPTQWPNTSGYTLVSISLNRSLQMGLNQSFNN